MEKWMIPGSIYHQYVYSYPHKMAYRAIEPQIPLHELWEAEDRSSLFLYLHVPFCEFRCGFCNLFTRAIPPVELPTRYLEQLRKEANVVRDQIGDVCFARMAIGGGTPTYLDEFQLVELFDIANQLGADPHQSPCGIECSPATLTQSKLNLLLDYGVRRISVGVQSFSKEVCQALGRPQNIAETRGALDRLRGSDLKCLNVDLIYGADQQTRDDFVRSIDELLHWQPNEIFIYPLYVRPLTGLSKNQDAENNPDWDTRRLACYQAGRERLLAAGYTQHSMRMFTRDTNTISAKPDYCCQSDGMLGIGCGARSYTQAVHYSTEYAVGRSAIHAILASYLNREPSRFAAARHGYQLDIEEQVRRYALLSLLHVTGIETDTFQSRFQNSPEEALPELHQLLNLGYVVRNGSVLRLNDAGLERSDQIGPLLFSSSVREKMERSACV